jgi:Protein of unknown function (DUF1190)
MKRIALLAACVTALVMGGCGQAKPKAGPAAAAAVGIFTSADDCAATEKLTVADCSRIIQAAVEAHQNEAKTYISARLCEEGEGADRCERMAGNKFTTKLLAFMVTFSKPPVATPLYPISDRGALGFMTRDKSKKLLTVDETITVSDDAKRVAENNVFR